VLPPKLRSDLVTLLRRTLAVLPEDYEPVTPAVSPNALAAVKADSILRMAASG